MTKRDKVLASIFEAYSVKDANELLDCVFGIRVRGTWVAASLGRFENLLCAVFDFGEHGRMLRGAPEVDTGKGKGQRLPEEYTPEELRALKETRNVVQRVGPETALLTLAEMSIGDAVLFENAALLDKWCAELKATRENEHIFVTREDGDSEARYTFLHERFQYFVNRTGLWADQGYRLLLTSFSMKPKVVESHDELQEALSLIDRASQLLLTRSKRDGYTHARAEYAAAASKLLHIHHDVTQYTKEIEDDEIPF